jgi:RNA recognition motif-containing protein
MRDPDSGNSKGYAFINFANFDGSDTALEAMNGQYLCNRPITVSYAFKKEAKGERHGSAAERLLAAQNPLSHSDKPHTLFVFFNKSNLFNTNFLFVISDLLINHNLHLHHQYLHQLIHFQWHHGYHTVHLVVYLFHLVYPVFHLHHHHLQWYVHSKDRLYINFCVIFFFSKCHVHQWLQHQQLHL